MFIEFPQPIAELQDNPKPRVWVKIGERKKSINYLDYSVFINNEALAKYDLGTIKMFSICDEWLISDAYYGECVREGKFVPIDDLNEVDDICEQAGFPPYEMDLGF